MEFIGPREAKKGISLKAGGLRKSKSKVKKEEEQDLWSMYVELSSFLAMINAFRG
jgi:hypothetical protein